MILIVASLIILSFFFGFIFSKISFTGRVVQEQELGKSYTWTKAICNSNNECFDVKIVCEDGNAVSIVPVSRVVQHSSDWEDPRDDSEKLCSMLNGSGES